MGRIEKIDDIRNEVEGAQLGAILQARGIPHYIRSYHDSAYDGLYQVQFGWGYVEAPSQYRGQILSVLRELRESSSPPLPEPGGPQRN